MYENKNTNFRTRIILYVRNRSVADTGPPPPKTTAPTLSGSLIRVNEAGELPAFHII